MAQKLPTEPQEFEEIIGVGPFKLEKYGNDFLDIIKY